MLARRFPGARAFERMDDALQAGPIDVVHMCTPLVSHVRLSLAALEAGCHVLVEKPFAEDLQSTNQLLTMAADRQRLLCPVHQFLFQRGALKAARELDSVGPLRHLEMAIASTGANVRPLSRDEVALEILPHALAFAARFCKAPIDMVSWECQRPAPGELTVAGTVGEVGVWARISMRGRPPSNELRLVAERGTIHLDLFHGFAIVDRSQSSKAMKIAGPFLSAGRTGAMAASNLLIRALLAETAYPGLRELVRRFYAAVTGNAPSPILPSETSAVMNVWDLIRRRLVQSAPPDRTLVEATS